MSLTSEAQLQPIVLELPMHNTEGDVIAIYDNKPSKEQVLEVHEEPMHEDVIEVTESEHSDEQPEDHSKMHFELTEYPGVPLEVQEHLKDQEEHEVNDLQVEELESKDEVELKEERKPKDAWDWQASPLSEFLSWVQQRMNHVPKHNGQDSTGLERAIAYLERIDSEIAKAMRSDYDGLIDANSVEEARKELEEGVKRLKKRLDVIHESKGKKKKKAETNPELVKEAQKITGVKGIMVTVPLLIHKIVTTCINGSISAGKDIEDLFAKQCKTYKLTDREKAEALQLMSDMGYTVRRDRGFLPDEEPNEESEEGMDWSANYQDV